MSELIAWIAAVAEEDAPDDASVGGFEERIDKPFCEPAIAGQSPAHVGMVPEADPTASSLEQGDVLEELYERERERRFYRGRTMAMLRKYMRYSLETGRLPSLVGREFFRSKVTKYRVTTFEDRVIFVHDMENCLQRIDEFSRQVLARIVLQEYEHEEAARLLGCTRMSIHRWLMEALDKLSDVLIAAGLLELAPQAVENSCQGGEEGNFFGSDEEQRK